MFDVGLNVLVVALIEVRYVEAFSPGCIEKILCDLRFPWFEFFEKSEDRVILSFVVVAYITEGSVLDPGVFGDVEYGVFYVGVRLLELFEEVWSAAAGCFCFFFDVLVEFGWASP